MKQQKKDNSKILYIIIVILLIFVFASFFGGKRYSDSVYEDSIRKKDSLIEVVSLEKETLLNESLDAQTVAEEMRSENERLQQNNNNLYYELKKQIRLRRVIDTSFYSNALYLSKSVNRYYEKQSNAQ